MQNATKIMLCSTDSTFLKEFTKNSRFFPQNSSIFPDMEIQEFFQDFKVRGNPVYN